MVSSHPMIGLSFAAAATSTIGIATGVLLLPEHNPVLMTKQAAIVIGGNSNAALRRVVAWGDGWYRFNLDGWTTSLNDSPNSTCIAGMRNATPIGCTSLSP